MARFLIITGLVFVALGLFWPWLKQLPLGRLPGDVIIHRDNFHFYFPVTTSVVISVVLSILFWLLKK